MIETVVRAASGKVPVVAGCGSNDTRKTVSAARRSAEAGADALLVVSPYYNKPNRTGILGHYRAVAEATDLPVVVYNVPGRTGQNLGARLILELTEIPGIAAVKEASADLDQMATILRDRPSGFAVLSGDDPLAVPAVALGADGVVIPHVLSLDEARTAVSFFDGVDVWSPANPDGAVVAMLIVEDPEVFAELEAIADIPGYSALVCGIGSLTSALGGDREAAEATCLDVLDASTRAGMVDLMTVDASSVALRVEQGFLALLAYGPQAQEAIRIGRAFAGRP